MKRWYQIGSPNGIYCRRQYRSEQRGSCLAVGILHVLQVWLQADRGILGQRRLEIVNRGLMHIGITNLAKHSCQPV